MTGEQIRDLTTSLLDGEELGQTAFLNLVNVVKNNRERIRPWRYLLTEDSSETASAGDTYETEKDLPSLFRRTLPRNTMVLKRGDTVLEYSQIPFSQKIQYRESCQRFYIDYKNSKFYLCGEIDGAYTIHLFYIAKSADIKWATEWIFPEEFHPMLAFDVAVLHKGGIDYDLINERMARILGFTAESLTRSMIFWDDELQRAELEGQAN